MLSLESLFCHVDDFCQWFEPAWQQQLLGDGLQHRRRCRSLCLSEIMTILIAFHQSAYRNFKWFYTQLVSRYWRNAFPGLVSYQRFVEWMPSVLIPLCAYLRHCFGRCTGISFIDATSIKVCHNRRIASHKVFKPLAARGKTSVDWFFGFKLHLVVNEQGELLNVLLTPGNTDDRLPVPQLLQQLFGTVFGDRGYVSQKLAQHLWQASGIQLVTKLRRNMKNRLMSLRDKLLLRRRGIIESIIDQLKNISQIEHSRHRSPVNCFVNLVCGLIAYCHQPKKPSLLIDAALPASA
ncbi:IS982 family transposase [Trichocoleus sp. DQ-A3]|uniref:IS982 family transposase n=1 Tax=Cyanophyceae TaxID=3028117 RepID=UPI0016885147|nr:MULTISPECIES: IS982 family transposase [unclassified Coleofasciculus]MBD1901579.1 IS982 family transposase [Coleofasciculus sp. FACHB-125]MBD2087407.1 IS982 family transposase [Coleofasciculus sp. FACHB-542]